jgi:hypothetical protein
MSDDAIEKILVESIGHINEEGRFCATYKGRACNCGIKEAAQQIRQYIETEIIEEEFLAMDDLHPDAYIAQTRLKERQRKKLREPME